jgi:hypothetical protein
MSEVREKMPKYKGTEVEVRFATTQAGLTSATAVGSIASVTWKVDQGITLRESGLGSRATVAKEGLVKVTGTIVRDYDETVVDGTSDFATEANAFETAALTRHWLEVKNKTTGTKYQFGNVIGTCEPMTAPSVDGIVTQRFDFSAESVTKTT